MVMALEAGAELTDMEFPMFLPACFGLAREHARVDLPYISSTVLGGWWLKQVR